MNISAMLLAIGVPVAKTHRPAVERLDVTHLQIHVERPFARVCGRPAMRVILVT